MISVYRAAVAELVRRAFFKGRGFESRFGHGWRGPSVIRLLNEGPAALKWMTSLSLSTME